MRKEEFVKQTYAAALRSSEQSGMPPLVTVAQAALESNWGNSRLSREGHNFFGIKAHGTHERIRMCTHECEGARTVTVEAQFAKYGSIEQCIECRDSILLRSGAYAAARRVLGDEQAFIREMARHWATDPKYAEKLQAMLTEVKGLLG